MWRRRAARAGAARRRRIWSRAAILLGTGVVAGTLTEGGLSDALRTGGFFALALAIGLALLSLAGWAMLRGFRWFLRRSGARLAGRRAARHGESVPAGKSGAGRGGGARRRRDVHADRLPGAERPGGSDSRLRAAGHAQRLPARHSGQPAHRAQRLHPPAARREGSARRGLRGGGAHHRHRRRAHREPAAARFQPALPAHPLGDRRWMPCRPTPSS